jgi:AhpD family alkylhydroperoxidase
MNVNYYEINKRAVDLFLSIKKHTTLIDKKLQALVEIRVSQINGCAFCIDLHLREAKQLGMRQQVLDCLPEWRESLLFTENESIALDWAESVTNISTEPAIEDKLTILLSHFSEAEAVDLTLIISLMNSLNRLSISFGDKPVLLVHDK